MNRSCLEQVAPGGSRAEARRGLPGWSSLLSRRHRRQTASHASVLLVFLALIALDGRQNQVLRVGLGLLGLLSGAHAAWLTRRTVLVSDRLAEEQERRQTFVSVVAHELNNRMTPLLAYSQYLLRGGESAVTSQTKALAAIAAETQRLRRLTSDLLDVARLQSGRLAIQPEAMDLVQVARSVVESEQLAARHRIVLDAPERLEGVWDRDRVAQALTNLVSNAIKYSPDGEEVRLAIRQMAARVEVSVQDQGIGLEPDDIPLLFEPYSRLYRERRAKGLGLGLFITRGVVEAHGGTIEANSPGPGQGSIFAFTLPLRLDERAAAQVA